MAIPVGSQIDMGSQKIVSLLDPTSAQDAATKNYVDSHGANSTEAITQTTHGFSVGNAIYYSGLAWAKAKADSADTLGIGVVGAVADVNNFTVYYSGYITGLSGLTAGQYYFVSDSSAGVLTATEPTTANNFSNPLLFALTTTTGIVLPFRPSQIESVGARQIVNKAINYTALSGDIILVDTTSGDVTITLLAASSIGSFVTVKKTSSDAHNVIISRAGSDTIDGQTTQLLTTQYESIDMVADGSTHWEIV